MNAWRLAELHQVLYFVREARAALAAHDLPRAYRWNRLALQGLFMVRGISCRPGSTPTATATLATVVANLSDDIERALRPAPQAEAHDLVEPLFETLKVLQRKGVEVEDELLLDRARNGAMNLAGLYRFTAIETAPAEVSTGNPRPNHAN